MAVWVKSGQTWAYEGDVDRRDTRYLHPFGAPELGRLMLR